MSAHSSARHVRLISLGDQLLAGVGDERALGWLGRVLARTNAQTQDRQPRLRLESYAVPSPDEGTHALSERWLADTSARLSGECENRLILALGGHDLRLGQGTARSRLHLANVLDGAAQLSLAPLVIGPAPSGDPAHNDELAQLNSAFADVALRRRNPYVDVFGALAGHEPFLADLRENDGVPSHTGYGYMAWAVLNQGWYDWLEVQPVSVRN